VLDVAGNLLDRVRATCADVAAQAMSVHIDDDALGSYATALQPDVPQSLTLDPEHHYLGHGTETVTFLLTLDAINFGSGYFPHLERIEGLSGYFTVAHHLTAYFREHAPVSASELASLTAGDCARIFGQSMDDPDRAQLMRLFAGALNEFGIFVDERYADSVPQLVDDAAHSAAKLVTILTEMPSFRDIAVYRGAEVAFLKRAQLAVSDLNVAFRGTEWGAFDDLSELTIFADNTVPHVLHVDGVLRYVRELGEQIRRGEPLVPGSDEEIEIRACAVTACERIAALIRRDDATLLTRDLDYLLWNRGQLPRYRATLSHRTRTIAY
jgi:Potential Queuosine, Q, salvage protein family